MNRGELTAYIEETYNAEAEHPWDGGDAVFRHRGNRKWFALIMEIPQSRLGLPGDRMLDILNLKCDPLLIGALRQEPGFFPAYHMSKAHWITLALDGSVEPERIKELLDMSFRLTEPKPGKRRLGGSSGEEEDAL